MARYERIDGGEECERWLPLLSAIVDGEATPEQLLEIRPHLRNCGACRATVRELHATNAPLAALLPVALAPSRARPRGGSRRSAVRGVRRWCAQAPGGDRGGVDRKFAAVAASAAAIAGGGAVVAATSATPPAHRAPHARHAVPVATHAA